MRVRLRLALIAAVLSLVGGRTAHAQTDHAHLGVHGLYNSSFDDWGIGAQGSVPIAHHLEFYPSFDYYFESPGTMWEGNVDFKLRALGAKFDWVYVGSGLNIHRQSIPGNDLTRAGWNLLAGAESIRGKVHPFGEVRVTVTDNTRFQVQAGINITLGKS